jgi:hypothetical protein
MESAISQMDWNKLVEGKASPWVIAVLLVFLLLPFIKLIPSFVSMQRESRKTRCREAHRENSLCWREEVKQVICKACAKRRYA